MRCVINAWSCTNQSGKQVLCGLLAEGIRMIPQAEFHLLLHGANLDIKAQLVHELDGMWPDHLTLHEAPARLSHWLPRAVHERLQLPALLWDLKADCYLSLSGGWTPSLPCPHYTLALNPWALMDRKARQDGAWIKPALQRWNYRRAMRHADGIGFGSGHMQDLYRRNAGCKERGGAIVYPALSRGEIRDLENVKTQITERDPYAVLCVSHMGRHKNIIALLEVVHQVRVQHQVPVSLTLAGSWPDAMYRTEVEQYIHERNMMSYVSITGHLDRRDLLIAYRRARVYALLSRCESFGIPSVEAQWMGTPVLAASTTAAPEICGDGGYYVHPDDLATAVSAMVRLLKDDVAWSACSRAAQENAKRFEYKRTAEPLWHMMGIV